MNSKMHRFDVLVISERNEETVEPRRPVADSKQR